MQRYNTKNEAAFLRQQAEDAKVAMHQTIAEMQENVKAAVQVRQWTQHSPWIAVGAATVLGFVSTSVLTKHRDVPSHHRNAQSEPAARSSLVVSWLSPLVSVVRGALVSMVVSSVMDAVNQPEQDPSEAGYASPINPAQHHP